MSSFDHEKQLAFTITMGAGSFGPQGNQVTLTGHRALVEVEHGGGQMMSAARIRIYGLPLDMMNKLTTLTFQLNGFVRNSIEVSAVDGRNVTTVFSGDVFKAYADFQAAPDVCLYMEAQAAFHAQVSPAEPQSYSGPTDVSAIFGKIASTLGIPLENNGVQGSLNSPYLPGSIIDQLRSVSAASRTDYYLDSGVLAICPRNTARNVPEALVPLISKDTGMVGYPVFDQVSVTFTTLFNPAILFGGLIKLESIIKPANGVWHVCSVNHRLESVRPGGAWFSQVICRGDAIVSPK